MEEKSNFAANNNISYFTFARFLFIGTTFSIAFKGSPILIFGSDWFKILNMILFALSNGYNGTLLMIYGPQEVDTEYKESAGMVCNLHLLGGIFMGCLFATFVTGQIL
jgi:hypothetical protein